MALEDDIDALARTLWGEARGEGEAGMRAVAMVIVNRKNDRRWPNTLEGVCKQPAQFSCWNLGDPNRAKLLAVDERDPHFATAKAVATEAAHGRLLDETGGANHYHTHSVHPNWSKNRTPTMKLGNHRFFKL